jgi:hypothetical protein
MRLRVFSISRGWLTGPIQVSRQFGTSKVWPGDTVGISALPGQRVALSWGSAVANEPRPPSEIFATVLAFPGITG